MQLQRFPFHAMGGPCELHLYLPPGAEHLAQQVIAEVRRIEHKYSRYRTDSVLSQINNHPERRMTVDAETVGLLNYAATAYQLSDGLFDITSGVLRQAWDFKSGQLPEPARLASLLPRVGWQHLHWNPAEQQLYLPAGMELDFGGIGKEYAADCAARWCRQLGIQHGLVELGGDIAVVGAHPDGRPWRVGVRHPRAPQQMLAWMDLQSGGLASSGDYERYMVIDGQRYCHVLNPNTGYPVSGVAGVSVQAEQCLIAGSAATIAMLKGVEAGTHWLQQLGLAFLLVDSAIGLHRPEPAV